MYFAIWLTQGGGLAFMRYNIYYSNILILPFDSIIYQPLLFELEIY